MLQRGGCEPGSEPVGAAAQSAREQDERLLWWKCEVGFEEGWCAVAVGGRHCSDSELS